MISFRICGSGGGGRTEYAEEGRWPRPIVIAEGTAVRGGGRAELQIPVQPPSITVLVPSAHACDMWAKF